MLRGYSEKQAFYFDISMTLGPGQEMTFTLINHIPSLVVCFCQLSGLKISIVFTLSHVQAYVSRTDLAVNSIKVILGSPVEQTTQGWRNGIDFN